MIETTLCYIECGDQYLMLHRTKKKNDCNHDAVAEIVEQYMI